MGVITATTLDGKNVTLAAAIALTVMTGGSGPGTLGATLSSNALAATMISAAVIGMGSTLIGQLAGGASFDQAFKTGVKAGATSALMAGVSYGAMSALDLHPQYDAAGNVMRDAQNNVLYQSASGAEYAKLSAVERLTDSRFWALTAANSTAYGALAAANGGQFGPAFGSGVMSSLGANLNALVGDWAYQNNIAEGSLSKIALHAGIGALQAGATRQDALAGAIGGATAEALSRFNNQLDQLTGNKAASELTTAGASIIANQLLNKNPDTTHLTAATQALQTDRNNRQLHVEEKKLIRSLAEQKAREGCQVDTQCLRSATLYWTDALERVAESRTDDKEFLKTAQYLNQLEKTATIQGSEGQMGAVSRYFADLETAARMLDPYTGKTIVVNGQTATLNGANQTYFSATPDQRANTSGNYFLNSPPDPSIIPGMTERDQSRLEQAGVKSGSVQPVYPVEEIALGGPLTSKVLGALVGKVGALTEVKAVNTVAKGEIQTEAEVLAKVHSGRSPYTEINGAIGEAQGWRSALESGHVPVASPGKTSVSGPDFVTYDPSTRSLVVWDAKYRAPGGSYPSSLPASKLQSWQSEISDAVKNMPAGADRIAAEKALRTGQVEGRIFKWPQ